MRLCKQKVWTSKYSVESRFSKFGTCKKNDLVLFKDAGAAKGVAKVLGHFEVGGIPISMVIMYKVIMHDTDRSSIMEPCSDGATWIETEVIVDTLVYCTLPSDHVIVLVSV